MLHHLRPQQRLFNDGAMTVVKLGNQMASILRDNPHFIKYQHLTEQLAANCIPLVVNALGN